MTRASHFDLNTQHSHAEQCWILISDHQSQLNRGEYKHGALNEGHSLNAASWALSPQKTYAPMTPCQALIRKFLHWSFTSKHSGSKLVYMHTTSQLAVSLKHTERLSSPCTIVIAWFVFRVRDIFVAIHQNSYQNVCRTRVGHLLP